MTRTPEERTRSKVAPMLLAQATAYLLLALAAMLSVAAGWTDGGESGVWARIPSLVAIAAVLLVFVACWPLRATFADRVASVVFGVMSVVFAVTPLVWTMGLLERSAKFAQCDAWALGAGGLLVLLVVFAFGRQMAREERSHLIRSLSHSVTSGTAAISVGGWAFLPTLLAAVPESTEAVVALVVIVVFALALAFASVYWLREVDPDPAARHPWVGVGMLPVMLMGVTVALATLVLTRL
ncbi:hypothetical protein BLEM_0242 [Bifidobacterium lemurum]|uniref:Uncharacterized protein n=1 Tax=Bifidobacterium lemurum TaxID=1603886 RepID=A0A261FUV4_9BIFI|nr:hypothetical protein [Bifidobacterium lemurum]OZG62977.1 hypothetical protein BLEM_0242 [Bifidobacterium lemurum]QOL33326.1 hypothetical protein BL8807_05695 [Bifidobacterium lemurum]